MAKQRHSTQAPEGPSRGPMVFLVIGALLVTGLVAWALTRTVDTPAPVPAGYTAANDTSATYDTAASSTQTTTQFSTETSTTPTPIASATAPIVTTTHAATPAMEGDKAEVKRISAEDLREKVNANAVTVIDVRDASSYAAAHIPGSLHIPLASVEANLDRLPKGKPIVAYCT
jgi:hypothetical protein